MRVIQAEYPQDWLTTKAEDSGLKQAEWRTDPNRSGAGGCIGDIGTHAYNLIRFITGLEVDEISADIHTFVEGRKVDDNAQIMLRFKGGAKGSIWSSQVAVGNENNLKIRIYGENAGIEYRQEYDKSNNCYPTIDDGIDGMKFIENVIKSSKNNSKWIQFNSN